MTSTRRLVPELLDQLPASDPAAQRARRDLRRVNAWMGNARILARALQQLHWPQPPRRIVEIGAGDGTFLLSVARLLSPTWREVEVLLIDRQLLLAAETKAAFSRLGWNVTAEQMDIADWLRATAEPDVVVANLFLHHFTDEALRKLFLELSEHAPALVACEPRRFAFPKLAGNLVWFIGCNAITRHDAAASVEAGFVGQELSKLWAARRGWELIESEAGLFSHCFVAYRQGAH